MNKKNIAVVWGGYSSEEEISKKSAEGICNFLDKSKYNAIKVCITHDIWQAELNDSLYPIDKNNFTFTANNQLIKFDFVYNIVHGTPGEDGPLQGYFDMLNICYSSSGVLSSALTFNKYVCNNYLRSFGFKVADSVLLKKGDHFILKELVDKLKLPLFVKPNLGGSSVATTKVNNTRYLKNAVIEAFGEADEVIVESFIDGIEVTCGCYKGVKGKSVLPVTEIVTHNDFFDFKAKYEGEVEEITPARIAQDLTDKIQQLTSRIYDIVNAKGIIRVDYIIKNNEPYLLEVNTIPGMTETSFIPQQVEAAHLNMSDVLSEIIEYEYKK